MFVLCVAAHIQHTQGTRNRGGRDSRCNAPEDAIKIPVALVMRYQKQCDSRVKGDSRGKTTAEARAIAKARAITEARATAEALGESWGSP